jgi:hypothetical protein
MPNNLEKCLKDLEKIRRTSLKKLAKNCKSETMRKSAVREIEINYASATGWIKKIYLAGRYEGKIDLSRIEEHNEDDSVGYFSSHLYYHLNQIRILGERHS